MAPTRPGAGRPATITCDTTLLTTRRGEVWMERGVRDGAGSTVCAPSAYFNGNDDEPYPGGGMFGSRPRRYWRGPDPQSLHLLTDGRPRDRIGAALVDSGLISTPQIWNSLLERSALVARRPVTLDRLVAAGTRLDVRSARAEVILSDLPLPRELGEALMRRIRFVCVLDELDAERLHVFDMGWSNRR